MVVCARRRWLVTVAYAALAVAVAYSCGVRGGPKILLVLLPIVVIHRLQLSADEAGVTVVNFGRARRVAWEEIRDVRFALRLELRLHDGRRVQPRVARAYPPAAIEAFARELRRRLRAATAVTEQELDDRALEDALVAADAGQYVESSLLVADGRIDAHRMAELLVARYKARRR